MNFEYDFLNKYAIKMLENNCFIYLESGKLFPSYLLAVISEKSLRPMFFLMKIKSHCYESYAKYKASGGKFTLISGNIQIFTSHTK